MELGRFLHAGDRLFHRAQNPVEIVPVVQAKPVAHELLSAPVIDRPEIKVFDPKSIVVIEGMHKGDTFIRLIHKHK